MLAAVVLFAAVATSPPLLQKAAPAANPSVTGAPLLRKAAPAPRSSQGARAVRKFSGPYGAPARSNVVVHTTNAHGAGWGVFGLLGVFGLVGLWKRWVG